MVSKKIKAELEEIEKRFRPQVNLLNSLLEKEKVYYGHRNKKVKRWWLKLEFVKISQAVTRSDEILPATIRIDPPMCRCARCGREFLLWEVGGVVRGNCPHCGNPEFSIDGGPLKDFHEKDEEK